MNPQRTPEPRAREYSSASRYWGIGKATLSDQKPEGGNDLQRRTQAVHCSTQVLLMWYRMICSTFTCSHFTKLEV